MAAMRSLRVLACGDELADVVQRSVGLRRGRRASARSPGRQSADEVRELAQRRNRRRHRELGSIAMGPGASSHGASKCAARRRRSGTGGRVRSAHPKPRVAVRSASSASGRVGKRRRGRGDASATSRGETARRRQRRSGRVAETARSSRTSSPPARKLARRAASASTRPVSTKPREDARLDDAVVGNRSEPLRSVSRCPARLPLSTDEM